MSNKNIFQRVAAITAELGAIAKDLTVGEGDKAYSATSEATILAAVKPLEEKHGVFSYAVSRTLDQKIVEKPYMWNGEQRLVRLVMATVSSTLTSRQTVWRPSASARVWIPEIRLPVRL